MVSKPAALCRTQHDLWDAHDRARRTRGVYLACARRMEEISLPVIAHAFHFTAAQEKEQAAIFQLLSDKAGGEAVCGQENDAGAVEGDPADILAAFAREEWRCAERLRDCAASAEAQGSLRAAGAFRRIAENEERHARRFRQYADALAAGTLFRAPSRISWICLSCGELATGTEPPEACAGCGKARENYIRSDGFPFAVEG